MYKEYSTDNELCLKPASSYPDTERVFLIIHIHIRTSGLFPSNSNCLHQTRLQLIVSP